MRQVLIQIGKGDKNRVLQIAADHGAMNITGFSGESGEAPADLVIANVPNKNVGPLIQELQKIPELHITIMTQGTLPLRPPPSEAPDQVTDLSPLSPIEIVLSGLQSIGSWKGFLSYAAAAGIVVWIGMYTNTVYLLVAAMLIAPFAGPAMNAAIGTARGDWTLLRQGLLRYFASLGVGIAVSALLSLVLQQEVITDTMVRISELSRISVLLAITAGAAGASNLAQPERNSLVSGAAVGMLVAASLAPPAGLIGMSLVLERWFMALNGLFLLLIQLAGINLAGAVVFRLYQLTPKGVRYPRGKTKTASVSFAVTVLLLGALVWIQLWEPPSLERSSISGRSRAVINQTVQESGLARLVEANARFTRTDKKRQNTLLCVVYVRLEQGVSLSKEQVKKQLSRSIRDRIKTRWGELTPLVDVVVLDPGYGPE
ncbi:MAG: DUF389 domain-containing protein [Desulfovibrionales bacterium]